MNRRELIAGVKVRSQAVYAGEPFPIKVLTRDAGRDEPIAVSIDGVPGESQVLQFARPGRRKITVVARSRSRKREVRSVEVQVVPRPDFCGEALFPIIGIAQNFALSSGATFHLDNPQDFAGLDVYYVWDVAKNVAKNVGENVRIPTTVPLLDYAFDDLLDPEAPYTTFDVALHVKNRDGRQAYTGRRTLAVWNTHVLNRRRGLIQLKVRAEPFAHPDGENYVGRFAVTNPWAEPVAFDSVRVEYLYDDPERLSAPGEPRPLEWKIDGRQTLDRTFALRMKELPPDAFGFGVHCRGRTPGNLPACADLYFEVRANTRTVRPVRDPEVRFVLDAVRSRHVRRRPGAVSLPELRRLLDADPGFRDILSRSRLQPVPAADDLIGRVLGSGREIPPLTKLMSGEEEPVEGEECSPTDAGQRGDLTCQLTDEVIDEVFVPARIINARKGDVLLSPGDDSPVARMLRQLDPEQFYDHAGIMIQNFYTLKHSTPSIEWLQSTTTGLLTNLGVVEGLEGFLANRLRYIWPGTVEQTIDEAFEGSMLTDPDGEERKIKAFKNRSVDAAPFKLIGPLVVKPPPDVEAGLPDVRRLLHRVADKAKEIEAHYRFFCFTDADAFFDEERLAPDREWWAKEDKRRPTVCSSFIWAAAKSLENPAILLDRRELGRVDAGEVTDDGTRDGLYRYEEEERRAAGQALYDYICDEVVAKARKDGWVFGEALAWVEDAADDAANQICNAFASDWTGHNEAGDLSKDSDTWRKPGVGRAVSPDNIWLYWDPPAQWSAGIRGLYGYSEPLIYRLARMEGPRRVCRWKRTEGDATLAGSVLYRGVPAPGAYVVACGRDCVTNDAGEFEMAIRDGSYRVEAGKLINGSFMSAQQDVMGVQVGERREITLDLQDPDERFREVKVLGSMWITDSEWPGPNEEDIRDVRMDGIFVGPPVVDPDDPDADPTHAERKQTEKLGGEIKVRLQFEFDWREDLSVDVRYVAELFEGDTQDTDDREDSEEGAIHVPVDDTVPLNIHLSNPGDFGDDTADIYLIIVNDPAS